MTLTKLNNNSIKFRNVLKDVHNLITIGEVEMISGYLNDAQIGVFLDENEKLELVDDTDGFDLEEDPTAEDIFTIVGSYLSIIQEELKEEIDADPTADKKELYDTITEDLEFVEAFTNKK